VNKNVKRSTLILALTPLMSLPATAALAATTAPVSSGTSTTATVTKTVTKATAPVSSTTRVLAPRAAGTTTTTTTHTDAPLASASAVAAKVAGIITIGETSATAGSGSGTAHAHALDVLGQTVSGGDVTDGSKSGNILALPDNPVIELELAPWAGSVAHAGGGTQSKAEAALAHAGLLGELQLWLLHSQSEATWTPDASHGHASSDGAEVNLADQLDIKVLHAETDSSGKGSSAVLVVNGQGVLTSDQTGGQCKLDLDPLASILCLTAAGGSGANGTTTSTAEAVSETSGVGLPSADITGASSGGGSAATPPKTPTRHNSGGPLPHTTGNVPGGNAHLPFTGTESGLLAAYGAALAALGTAITAAARRRRGVAATA
jgi:hypothetical protein